MKESAREFCGRKSRQIWMLLGISLILGVIALSPIVDWARLVVAGIGLVLSLWALVIWIVTIPAAAAVIYGWDDE